jgi:hypothetical protein
MMDPGEFLVRRRTGLDWGKSEPKSRAGALDGRTGGVQTLGPLRVIGARAVLEKPWVREEERVSHGLPQSSVG